MPRLLGVWAQLALLVDEAPDKAPGEESDEAPKFENANQRFAASLISEPAQLTAFVGCLIMWAFFYLLSPPAVAFSVKPSPSGIYNSQHV